MHLTSGYAEVFLGLHAARPHGAAIATRERGPTQRRHRVARPRGAMLRLGAPPSNIHLIATVAAERMALGGTLEGFATGVASVSSRHHQIIIRRG
jgi:hypothetical protein